jgi:5'-deoxynucleotidase YfbR-like HD superfamily hydrolase
MKQNIYAQRSQFARRGGRVQRYHTHTTLRVDTVGQHSHNVAMLCIMFCDGKPGEALLMAALTHDLAEHILGDIPSPAKRAMDRDKLNAMETQLLRDVGFDTELSPFNDWVLKLADIVDGLLFCAEESEMGNNTLEDVHETYFNYFKDWSKGTPYIRAFKDNYSKAIEVATNIVAGNPYRFRKELTK